MSSTSCARTPRIRQRPIVSASDSFFVTANATESGTSAAPMISLGTLTAGTSTTATFPMSVPDAGSED